MELTGMVRRVPRHKILLILLLLIWVTVSVLDFYSVEEEVYGGNQSVPESLNITGVSKSFSEDGQTQTDNEDVTFESWMSRQSQLKENVRKVCDKYGKSLNTQVPLKRLMYDSKHKLLFCRNFKVKVQIIYLQDFTNIIIKRLEVQLGWHIFSNYTTRKTQ